MKPIRSTLSILALSTCAALASAQQFDSLTTTFASNNGQDGNMFDIKAINAVNIASLDCNFNAGSVSVEVYTVPGGYAGHEANSAAWTLRGSGATTSAGPDLPTPLPFSLDIDIPAGQTMGFYVTTSGTGGINYTDGTGLTYANADMELYEGIGIVYPFGNTYSPRTWNGTVYYNGGVGENYCFGDGTGMFCPCLNPGGNEEGCANSLSRGGRLVGGGSTSVSSDDLVFAASGLVPGQPAILFAGANKLNGGMGNLMGDGLRCAGGNAVRLGIQVPDAAGDASWGPGLAGQAGFGPGEIRNFQVWYGDATSSPCGSTFNLTHGVKVDFGS